MKAMLCLLVVVALLLGTFKGVMAVAATTCSDNPGVCTSNASVTMFCLVTQFTSQNGPPTQTSICYPGNCTSVCQSQTAGITCDNSGCSTGICTCQATQSGLTTMPPGALAIIPALIATVLTLVLSLAQTVPAVLTQLISSLPIAQIASVVQGIPLVGPVVGGLLLTVLNVVQGLGGELGNMVGGIISSLSGALGGLTGSLGGLTGGLGGLTGGLGGLTGSLGGAFGGLTGGLGGAAGNLGANPGG